MHQTQPAEITLTVPGAHSYALVIRTVLGGVAMLKDLDVDAMDDLRIAADEACDCLLNQGVPVRTVELSVRDNGKTVTVSLEGALEESAAEPAHGDLAMTRAVLETLIPRVALTCAGSGRVQRVDLTLPKAL